MLMIANEKREMIEETTHFWATFTVPLEAWFMFEAGLAWSQKKSISFDKFIDSMQRIRDNQVLPFKMVMFSNNVVYCMDECKLVGMTEGEIPPADKYSLESPIRVLHLDLSWVLAKACSGDEKNDNPNP
jgi:hypothetical protein